MAHPNKFLILACDPEENVWTLLDQTTDADEALEQLQNLKGDPSHRIMLNTADFITFDTEE